MNSPAIQLPELHSRRQQLQAVRLRHAGTLLGQQLAEDLRRLDEEIGQLEHPPNGKNPVAAEPRRGSVHT